MEVKTEKKSQKGAEQLFPALLFFVFLLCTVFTILIGSRVYENIRARDDHSFQTNTVLAYITNKVRQGDVADAVAVREMDGHQVLVLSAVLEGIEFETWIYQMDGGLYELMTQKDGGLDVSAGQRILDCESISFAIEEKNNGSDMLTIFLGEDRHADILLRSSGKEGGSE